MMQRLNKMFDGDWLLTVAAYNSGEGRVMKEMCIRDRLKSIFEVGRSWFNNFSSLLKLFLNIAVVSEYIVACELWIETDFSADRE